MVLTNGEELEASVCVIGIGVINYQFMCTFSMTSSSHQKAMKFITLYIPPFPYTGLIFFIILLLFPAHFQLTSLLRIAGKLVEFYISKNFISRLLDNKTNLTETYRVLPYEDFIDSLMLVML